MQILIALCSNILKTMTVVVFGGPLWFDHILWKLESMMLVHRLVERCESVYNRRSCRVHHPSEDLICETLVCLPQSCITYMAPLF